MFSMFSMFSMFFSKTSQQHSLNQNSPSVVENGSFGDGKAVVFSPEHSLEVGSAVEVPVETNSKLTAVSGSLALGLVFATWVGGALYLSNCILSSECGE